MHVPITSIILLLCSVPSILASLLHPLFNRAVSPDNTCGRNGTGGGADGYTCPSDLPCCSVNGFCGSTNAYCLTTAGCQSDFGNCTAPSAGTITPDETCGMTRAGVNGYTCGSDSPCCSGNGWCGNTTDYCTAEAGCQSAFGTCTGSSNSSTGSVAYCNAPDCQFNFGPACDANKVPSGTNTSSIPRDQIGSVLYGSAGIYDCANAGDMALTFDDGPFIYTSHIMDLLDKYNAKATFFITGINNGKGAIDNTSTGYPALIKRMYDGGHQLASHTWSHADLCNITSAQRKDEMYKNEMALRNIVGVIPTYMRPPYSSCNADCGCEADMAALGYHITYFDLDTSDYLNDSPSLIQNSKTIFDTALAGKSPSTDEFLVIGHDIHNQTANVLVEYMLQGLQREGYKAVTVGECLGDPKSNWYRTDTGATLGN
ncbi:carbohydrate esterase family 4 protein [Cadophora sp. DSE1049]|nr:carbohydrate esterase family 4 protein [Cadophora sp. DSE1049]